MLPGDTSLLRSRAREALLRLYEVLAIQLKVVVSRRRRQPYRCVWAYQPQMAFCGFAQLARARDKVRQGTLPSTPGAQRPLMLASWFLDTVAPR